MWLAWRDGDSGGPRGGWQAPRPSPSLSVTVRRCKVRAETPSVRSAMAPPFVGSRMATGLPAPAAFHLAPAAALPNHLSLNPDPTTKDWL